MSSLMDITGFNCPVTPAGQVIKKKVWSHQSTESRLW